MLFFSLRDWVTEVQRGEVTYLAKVTRQIGVQGSAKTESAPHFGSAFFHHCTVLPLGVQL